MAITAQNVKDCFPEFAGLDSDWIDKWLEQAERRVNLVQWAGKADDAILWLTGHLLKINCQIGSGGSAAAGPISQKKVGDLSVSFAVSGDGAMTKSLLGSTTYGQYYLELRAGVFACRCL